MDRLSALPKPILHAILAKLPDKDAARTIALSKAWRDTWFSFPYISVWSDDPLIKDHRFYHMDILVGYVTKKLLRLRDQGLAIKEFKLNLKFLEYTQMSHHHFDQWIQMASESGIEVLELYLPDIGREYSEDNWYILPLCVTQAKSLTKLVLSSGIRVDQEFISHSMKFSSLKMLSLCYILFTHDGILQSLISHCPLIEHLYVKICYVPNDLSTQNPLASRIDRVKSLFLSGLQNLKEVDVQGIEEVHIDSPNLENLSYRPMGFNAPFKLNFDSCTKLRCLCITDLESTIITDKWFLELFSKYPFLESLKLDNCPMSERSNIMSAQLKVLKLRHCSNLKEVNIDAPHLLSLEYCGSDKPVISLMKCSNKLEVRVDICVDYQHFYSLRDFILNIPQKILASLSLVVRPSYRDDPYVPAFQVYAIPPSIKHLEFREDAVPSSKALYGPLVNYLLSSCFPEKISFRYVWGTMHSFIEFFYEMLMGSKKGECHCSSGNRKCWWHSLKVVKISCSYMNRENVDLKSMFYGSRCDCKAKTITFSLEM
ncbi:hypothetical protein PIB30_012188 [Stylosanthes scabra]|uniref:F-box domain-containing protein n=1 Tax=Stylosanthes scabra TaxID=79078 RepID=A0ABU6U7J9_9FABA|nr:hypothetical protein [Stylosanthes scabra]